MPLAACHTGRSLFPVKQIGTKGKRRNAERRLAFEPLEDRALLALILADVDINDTPALDDNITLYNPKGSDLPYQQTISAKITNTGDTAAVFKLKAENHGAGRVKLNVSSTPNLQPGESFEFTITPTHASSALRDVWIIANNGKLKCTDLMTVVSVDLPSAIYNSDSPASMVKQGIYRIPPTMPTLIPVKVTPNLGSSTQVNVTLEGQGSGHGEFTVDGDSAMETLTMSKSLQLIGTTQTAASVAMDHDVVSNEVINTAAAAGNPNAGQLKLAVHVRGQNTIQTKGFSVSAIPIKFYDTFDSPITGASFGIKVQDGWVSDSGSVADLDEIAIRELVQYKDNGIFKGVVHGNSGYLGPSNTFTTDSHTLPAAIVTPAKFKGTETALQTSAFTDYRSAAVDISMPNSGFKITKEVFQKKGTKEIWETTTKVGFAVKAPNGDKVGAGETYFGGMLATITNSQLMFVLPASRPAPADLALAYDSRTATMIDFRTPPMSNSHDSLSPPPAELNRTAEAAPSWSTLPHATTTSARLADPFATTAYVLLVRDMDSDADESATKTIRATMSSRLICDPSAVDALLASSESAEF